MCGSVLVSRDTRYTPIVPPSLKEGAFLVVPSSNNRLQRKCSVETVVGACALALSSLLIPLLPGLRGDARVSCVNFQHACHDIP